ncbi:MAG: sugar ABC transporter ATP-binding protein, partial [Clostridiales bacterium]|nr:sugar ABC transporter ATP-binding protein [Clostridiales bacterium]
AATLSIAEQQLVEILRGLMRNAKLLILDEPTSSLTFNEVESLFQMVHRLKSQNISIIYITHRLNEVFEIADRAIIMSDGVITLNKPITDVTHQMLVQGLLPPDAQYCENNYCSFFVDRSVEPTLKVENLCGYGFHDVSFEVYPGEILGIAGIVGAGRTELATSIFGKDVIKSGKVYLDGEDITGLKTREVMEKGLNYVPEDRFLNGIFCISTVAENTTAACLAGVKNKAGLLCQKKERDITNHYIDSFHTKVTGCDQMMGSLSGGNQQKVVIGRALAINPKLIILDEPTRGIDAAARADVYTIIQQLREQGLAILLISSDMEEIIELSDRALTMFSGRINKEFERKDIHQDQLMSAAFGLGGKEK